MCGRDDRLGKTKRSRSKPIAVVALMAACAAGSAGRAAAQGTIGLGPRFSFVQASSATPDSPRERYFGGLFRFRMSPKSSIEASFDYHSFLNTAGTERTRDLPIQGSILVYPVRAAVSPYVLGGLGWYSQEVSTVAGGEALSSAVDRRLGYHAGIGAEAQVGKHVAVHLDYRYTFIHFNDASASSSPGALPLPGSISLQERLRLSHEGSMWTTGVTYYF